MKGKRRSKDRGGKRRGMGRERGKGGGKGREGRRGMMIRTPCQNPRSATFGNASRTKILVGIESHDIS